MARVGRPKGTGHKYRKGPDLDKSKYKLSEKDRKEAKDTPCISRPPHDKDCLCGGTGWIKSTK
jgi:hypothetical protein